MDEQELAALQAALLAALRNAATPDEARALLAQAPLSEASRQWLGQADARSLETAIALVRRWVRPLTTLRDATALDLPLRETRR